MEKTAGTLSYSSETQSKDSPRLKLAVNFAYTLNHAIICTATDPLTDVPIGMLTQKLLGKWDKNYTPSHNHSHSHSASHWIIGELTGDFGAVPLVTGMNHYAPGVMKAIGKGLAPIAKPVLRRSAERAAKREMVKQGLGIDSPEFKARADALLKHEMEHLPDAFMWTVFSPILNISAQKAAGSDAPIWHLAVGKAIGATVTTTMTVGLRSLSPDKAQRWDAFMENKVIGPVSSMVSHLFGVKKEEVQKGVEERQKQEEGALSWAAREEARRAGDQNLNKGL